MKVTVVKSALFESCTSKYNWFCVCNAVFAFHMWKLLQDIARTC